jgi:hypothetical protein
MKIWLEMISELYVLDICCESDNKCQYICHILLRLVNCKCCVLQSIAYMSISPAYMRERERFAMRLDSECKDEVHVRMCSNILFID